MLAVVLCLHRLDMQFHFLQEELKQQSIIYVQATPISEQLWDKVQEQVAERQSHFDQEQQDN